jgi:hypothetical protein
MNGEYTMTYRIRDKGRKISIFDKVNRIEEQLKQILPEIKRSMLIKALAKCRTYYEGNLYYGRRTSNKEERKQRKKRELTEIEKIIYQWLLKNNYNPSTTYRWFLATRVPDDIKEKLEKNLIPIRQAMIISTNRRKVKYSNIGLMMMEEMKTTIGGL